MPRFHTGPPRRWLLLPLALAACAALPRHAHAQQCTEEPCAPLDLTPPAISILPGNGVTLLGGSQPVTINWSDNYGLDSNTRSIIYDGTDVTAALGFVNLGSSVSVTSARSQGTLEVESGSHTLTASICDQSYYGPFCRTASVTWNGPPPAVRVTAASAALAVPGGNPAVARYRVVNTGFAATRYTLSATCSGGLSGCAPSVATARIAAGDSLLVDATFTAAGTGSVRLTAVAGSASGYADVGASALAAVDYGFPGDSVSLMRIERDNCFVMSMGPGVASECGSLRVVHALPGLRALNRARAPVLVYNHDHARPAPTVAAHVTPLAGPTPDSIRAVLTVNGAQYPGVWPGWASTQTRRIAIAFDASALNTGVYSYSWVVTAHFNNGAPTQTLVGPETRRLVVVNRSRSPFGKGWWLSGVEELHHLPGDSLKLWVGGDGSARLYRGPAAGPWTADGMDRLETLQKVAGTGGDEFVRLLPGGARVYFDGWGRHVRTVNTLGHTTTFAWSTGDVNTARLDQITLPGTADTPAPLGYTFEYNNNTATTVRRLSRVVSPGPVDYRYTQVLTDAAGRVTRITDPDSQAVVYGYGSTLALITQRTDRRGGVQRFDYQYNRFHGMYARPHPDSAETRVLLGDARSRGLRGSASVRADSVMIILDGARTEFCDCAWWTVDRWGAPLSMRDAYGRTTTYQRGDPRWAAQVTRVTAPNGFTTTATYDANGYLASTTAWDPYGATDGRDATTSYEWDPRWDAVTRVTLPEGETSQTQYDAWGRREWEQAGPSAARRVTYAYNPLTHARAPGMVESVTVPATSTLPAAVERYEYDARGNLSAVRDLNGVGPQMVSDRLGRTLVTISPINGSQFKYDSVFYGAVDQVDSTAARAGADRLVARNTYDAEGNLRSVSRQSSPDPAGILAVVTSWEYDLMGRRTVEIAPDGMRDSTYYDRAGNVTSVRTRRGHRIAMTYDALNRLTQRVIPQVRISGRQEGIARPTTSGLPTKYHTYPQYPTDPANCAGLNPSTDPDCDYVIPGDVVTLGYHPVSGALVQADNRDAQVARTYHPGGALATETQRIRTVAETTAGGNFTDHAYELAFTYDRDGRRATLQHPSQLAPAAGVPTRYQYDPVTGALAGVTDPLGNAFAYTYSARGEMESLVRPGGVVEQFRYDSIGRLTRNWMQGAGGTWLRDVSLGYDQRGKLLNSTDLYGGRDSMTATYSGLGHVRTTFTRTFGVDASVSRPVRYDDLSNNQTDPLGNLTSMENSSMLLYTDNGAAGVTRTWGGGAMTYRAGTGRQLTRTATNQLEDTQYDAAGNIVFVTDRNTSSVVGQRQDRASYFDAEGRLRAADMRRLTAVVGYETPGNNNSPYYLHFEEYRYDALGRRVWVRARRECDNVPETLICSRSDLRRVVWDGDAELYEIQVPGQDGLTAAQLENDTQVPPNQGSYGGQDRNLHYGRVLYTYGTALDKPLSVIRMLYADRYSAWPAPFALIPHWNLRGQAQSGTFANGTSSLCRMDGATQRCVVADWPQGWFPYNPSRLIPENWHGTLITEKQDASGLYYRRNRYYDPASGRFTQEDPIGLAGGLNVYGFANGDPVSYSDPYGLSAQSDCPPDCSISDWGGGGSEQSRGLGHVKKRHVRGRWGNQFVDMDDRSLRHILTETVENGRMVGAEIVRGEKRFIFERAWGAIGTRGERIARVVITEGGQLVTAFPAPNAFRAAGAGTASAAAARWSTRMLARAALYATIVGAFVDVALSPDAAGSSSCTGMCQE